MKWSKMAALSLLCGAMPSCAESASPESASSESSPRASVSALEQGGECLVGDETLEHACLHMKFGPFAAVTAQSYPGAVFVAVNTPHTAYNVALPADESGFQGAVLYQPTVSGEFALLSDDVVSVTVLDSAGAQVAAVGIAPGDAELCPEIGQAAVYALSDVETYTVLLDSADDGDVMLAVEYLGAEASCEETCEPLMLTASRTYWPPSFADDERELEHHVVFELPDTIPVTEGSAGAGLVRFTYANETEQVVCRYRGRGRYGYQFNSCSNGARPGDDVEAEYLKLHVQRGSVVGCGVTTAVELTIQPECDHHHDEE